MLLHGKSKSVLLTCKQISLSHASKPLSDATQVTPFIAVLASLSQQMPRDAHDSSVIWYD